MPARTDRKSKLMTKLHCIFFSLFRFFHSCMGSLYRITRFIAKSTAKSVLSEHEQRRIFSTKQQQQQFLDTAIDSVIDSNARWLSISPMVTAIKNKCAKTTVSAFLANFPTQFHLGHPLTQQGEIYFNFFLPLFVFVVNRYRLNSTSDEDEDDDYPIYQDYNEHMQYRDRLQEFPGRIPPRKKKETTEANTPPRKSRVSTNQNSIQFSACNDRMWMSFWCSELLTMTCGII